MNWKGPSTEYEGNHAYTICSIFSNLVATFIVAIVKYYMDLLGP